MLGARHPVKNYLFQTVFSLSSLMIFRIAALLILPREEKKLLTLFCKWPKPHSPAVVEQGL